MTEMEVEAQANPGTKDRSADLSKWKLYNEALIHSVSCSNRECGAYGGRCVKVRQLRQHFAQCYSKRRAISALDSCPLCAQFWQLLQFHARTCQQGNGCQVPQCNSLREKLAQRKQEDQQELERARVQLQRQIEELSVENRIAKVERDRQEVLQMIAQIQEKRQEQATMMSMG